MSNEAILLRIESLLVEIRDTVKGSLELSKEIFEFNKEAQKAIKDGKIIMGMDEETQKMFEYIKEDEERERKRKEEE